MYTGNQNEEAATEKRSADVYPAVAESKGRYWKERVAPLPGQLLLVLFRTEDNTFSCLPFQERANYALFVQFLCLK